MPDPRWFAPLLLALTAAASFWFADLGLPNPDEGAVLTAAARIARGAVFYRDLDAYWMPGAAYLLALVSGIFGEHLSVARAVAAAFYSATALSLYAIALLLLDRARAAIFALSLLSLKFLAWPAFTAYLYSDFSFAFACAAIALLLSRPSSPRALTLAGACTALACTSKQNVGIYLGLAAALWLAPRWREVRAFAGGGAVVLLPFLAYFGLHGALPALVDSALLRPFTAYAGTSSIPFDVPLRWWELGAMRGNEAIPYLPHRLWHMLMQGELPGWDHYLGYWAAGEVMSRAVYTSVPLAFAWAVLRRVRSGATSRPEDMRLFGFAWLTLAVVASAFPRADWFHVASVYPLVLLLLFGLARRADPGRPWLAATAVGGVLALTGALSAQLDAQMRYRLELPRANLWIPPSDAWIEPLVTRISEEVGEGQPFFVYGHEAHYYYLAGRFSPWRFSQLYPGQTGVDGSEVVEALLREPPAMVVRGLFLEWEGVPTLPDYTPALSAHIESDYATDYGFFTAHPPPAGHPPPGWVAAVLRRREGPDFSGVESSPDGSE